LKIGLLGFGFMGKTHAYAIDNLRYFFGEGYNDVKIKSVCTSRLETAENASRIYGIPGYTVNEDDVINDPDIDVIDVCTPNIFHYQSVKKALNAGKHVYCEKPLAVTYAQAKELSELCNSKGLKCQIVFNNRFMPAVMKAKEIMESGRIANTVSFRFVYRHASCTDPNKKAGWKQNSDVCGGGVLFDLGSHAIDLCRYLCGDISSISGRSQIYYKTRAGMNGESWNTNADEAFYMTAVLSGGGVGTIEANKLAIGTNDELGFDIFGEKGALSYSLMQPNYLRFYDSSRDGGYIGGDRGFTDIETVGRYPLPGGIFPSFKAPVGWLMGHVECYRSFIDSVRNNKVCSPSIRDGASVQKIMELAYESDRKNGVFINI
jgi:predicted dehydrogenase